VMKTCYDRCGHKVVQSTFLLVKERFYWYTFYQDANTFVETCLVFQIFSKKRYEEPLHPIAIPTIHRIWFIDVQFMPKHDGYIGIIEGREGLTGWVEANAIKNTQTETWIDFIYEYIFCRFGLIGQIMTDNGELNSHLGLAFERKYRFQLSFSTTYHPQSNAAVEAGHKPIRHSIERSLFGKITDWINQVDCNEIKKHWKNHLQSALWADRITVRKSRGYSPFFLLYGHHAMLPVELDLSSWYGFQWRYPMTTVELIATRMKQLERRDIDLKAATETLNQARIKSKEYFDKRRNYRPQAIKVGDFVLLYESHLETRISRKFVNLWTGPYIVQEVREDGAYLISQLDDSASEVVSGSQIKLFKRRLLDVEGTNIGEVPVDVELLGEQSQETAEHYSNLIHFAEVFVIDDIKSISRVSNEEMLCPSKGSYSLGIYFLILL